MRHMNAMITEDYSIVMKKIKPSLIDRSTGTFKVKKKQKIFDHFTVIQALRRTLVMLFWFMLIQRQFKSCRRHASTFGKAIQFWSTRSR